MNTNMLHRWLKEHRQGLHRLTGGDVVAAQVPPPAFIPVTDDLLRCMLAFAHQASQLLGFFGAESADIFSIVDSRVKMSQVTDCGLHCRRGDDSHALEFGSPLNLLVALLVG